MTDPLITVITPTTGKWSLFHLMQSMDKQTIPWTHVLLWDDKREDGKSAISQGACGEGKNKTGHRQTLSIGTGC